MARVVVTLLVLAMASLWLLRDESNGRPVMLDEPMEDERTGPGLTGGVQKEVEPVPLPTVDDPVEYVLSSLRAIPMDERRAHLLALIDADPTFLTGLIEWVAAPDDRSVAPPGASTSDTVEAAVYRVLVLIGEPAVSPLVAVLAEGRGDARYEAARALGALGPVAEGAVEPLIQAARDPDADRYLRSAAVDALGAIGASSRAALPLMHTTLRDPECEEKLGLACARTLFRIGGASDEVFETCRRVLSEDWFQASAIVLEGLKDLGPKARPFVPDLLRLFDEPTIEEMLWKDVAPVLQAIGSEDDEVLSFLERMISTAREEGFRDGGAARALAGLGERGQQRLLEVSAPGSDAERLRVLGLLHKAGQESARLAEHIAQFLRVADPRFRQSALNLLQQARVQAKQVLPIVRPYLVDPDFKVRRQALHALGSAQGPSRASIEILQRHAEGKSEGLALAALSALEGQVPTSPDAALSIYLTALEDPRRQVAWSATGHLAKLAIVRHKQVVGAWISALEDPRIAQMAAMSLRDHASDDARAQKAFCTLLSDPSADLRNVAVHALGRVARPEDFDAILACAADTDARVRSSALMALRGFGSGYHQRMLDTWVKGLEDPHAYPRKSAARALQRAGAMAVTALPALERAEELYASKGYHAYDLRSALVALRGKAGSD